MEVFWDFLVLFPELADSCSGNSINKKNVFRVFCWMYFQNPFPILYTYNPFCELG